jgi:enoyl-CoA hydratase/carnithine racemase
MKDFVRYEVQDQVAQISIERPPVNAVNLSVLDELIAALRSAQADDNVRAVVLASAVPRRFSAGLDLNLVLGKSMTELRALLEKLYIDLSDAQYHLGKPSIAAVTGAARGGGMTLAISCDVLIAGESATFGYPEIDLGLLPAIHFAHLPRIVGRHRAFELLFSGRVFTADEACSLGLVSRVVPDEKVIEEARGLARTFAGKSRGAVQLGRAAFMRMNDYRRSIGEAAELFCNIATTDEAQEGIRAFTQKRAPNWERS